MYVCMYVPTLILLLRMYFCVPSCGRGRLIQGGIYEVVVVVVDVVVVGEMWVTY